MGSETDRDFAVMGTVTFFGLAKRPGRDNGEAFRAFSEIV
jgi:hypothetical protein